MNLSCAVLALTFLLIGTVFPCQSAMLNEVLDDPPAILLRSDYLSLLSEYGEKLEVAIEKQNELRAANLYYKKGEVHLKLHNYYSAIIAFQRCLKLQESHHDIELKSHAYGSLGNIYLTMGYYNTAHSYYEKAFQLGQMSGKEVLIANKAVNIAESYYLMDSLQQALFHYELADQLYRSAGASQQLSAVLNNKANIYRKFQYLDSAIFYYKHALEIEMKNQDLKGMLHTYLNLGETYQSKANYDKAVDCFQEAIVLSAVFEDSAAKGNALKLLAKTYEQADKRSLSFQYYQRYVSFEDSLQASREKDFKAIKAAVKHEKMALELKRLKNRYTLLSKQRKIHLWGLDSNRTMIIFLTTFVVLFILLVVLYYERYKEKKNRSRVLEIAVKKRTANLEVANKELDNFIYKTSHDVRGPIARIQGIINLGLIETKDKTSHHYFDLLHKVTSEFDIVLSRLFRIHNLYYHKPEVEVLNLRREILSLLNTLKRKNDLYDLEYRLDIPKDLQWKTDKLLLYMIIQNLYENALDYRVQGLTYILFSAEIINESHLRLKVKDNGIGIPEQLGERVFDMFFQSTRNSVTSGLGLYMVKKSVEKLRGTIALAQNSNEDTVFEITLPDS